MYPKQHRDLLHLAIEEGNRGRVLQIINENLDFVEQKSTQGERPLVRAIELNHIEIVKDLLEAGAHPDIGGWTSPLEAAVRNGNIEIVKLLLDAGADPNQNIDGDTPLTTAAFFGYFDIVKLLVIAGANVNFYDNNAGSPLYFAAYRCYKNIYEYLALVSSPEIKKLSDIAAFFSAVIDGNVETIYFLVESGVNINMIIDNLTPLMKAVYERQLSSVEVFIRCGADINLKNNEGRTALMFAARFRNSIEARLNMKGEPTELQQKLVETLWKAGADLETKDNNGKTALIHAIEFGSFKVVKLLIQLGANIFVRDSQNTSVLTYAKNINALLHFEQKHRLEIINFLQICGAIE